MTVNRARQLRVPLPPARVKPALKWAGGKLRSLDAIAARLPSGTRLIEPFVGAGAVFLNTDFDRYVINDVNKDLMRYYRILKRDGEAFIERCARLFTPAQNTEATFYAYRDEFNATKDQDRKAALFLYINKHGYNGLIRYNSSGEFNVPFGRFRKPYFPRAEMLHFVRLAKRVRIECRDFERVMDAAKVGDVIYCDPPYVPLTKSASFTAYSAGGFSDAEQERLVRAALRAANRGIPVLISNHCTSYTERIYRQATVTRHQANRSISCDGDNRASATELLALFE